ncbi:MULTISPECIES: ribonuclease J [unclassified Azospirillum]|uniref:ribonuclease J n=1 Tax=unclassified Azospirillum TaxID=2630922 RepID=UPI000B6C57C5|nr:MULTISPECIES: ribonuclease J [unclassified Azospirillum]SNS41350.1 ribonuclease J [Azospirillum sp. RU38E]SNS59944.1 ribonuclease J [Azospirillum sp. RU37A]
MSDSKHLTTKDFDPAALYFLPLGGSGEIGMNLNLYHHAGKWLMVDLGVSFADETTPGIEIILPDTSFIEERLGDLVGILVTHAHEDHLGAIPYLWEDLRVPVWCTPFAASFLKAKLVEKGLQNKVPIHVLPLGGRSHIGPFDIELISLTHSIPEPNAVVIRTPAGTVLHTGDWKLDPDPVIGLLSNETALQNLGREGVTAMVCDSTNALIPGRSGSESEVRDSFMDLFGQYKDTRIAVTCFASNVARLHSITQAAHAHDRQVALVGRSLWRINEAARENGYLTDLPPFLTEKEAGFLPREKVLLICTGSQGEARAALSRMATGEHPDVTLERGDVVIFSAREIPGNEKSIGKIQNGLLRRGIKIITADDAFVHVSGHPAREELVQMYQWVRPKIAIPVHGEGRHLAAHAELARDCQVPEVLVPEDGGAIRLAPGPAALVGHVHAGRLCIDGKRIVPMNNQALRGRTRMAQSGAVVVTLVMTPRGDLLADPKVSIMGLLEEDEYEEETADLISRIRGAVDQLSRTARLEDSSVKEAARVAVRRNFSAMQGRKPMTEIHLVRI